MNASIQLTRDAPIVTVHQQIVHRRDMKYLLFHEPCKYNIQVYSLQRIVLQKDIKNS